jgi:hypothetical protein
VAKKKLDLLQLAAGGAAKTGATSPEIMRREFADTDFGGELFDDVPDQLFRYSFTPNSAGAAHASEKAAHLYAGGHRPVLQ